MPDAHEHHDLQLPPLGLAGRLRASLHVLRTGDYQPASDYLRGVRHGLDCGLAIAWGELQQRWPEIGSAPDPQRRQAPS